MDPTDLTVTKFNVKNKTLYIKFFWEPNAEDCFHLKIFNGNECWSGKFTNESKKKNYHRCGETEHQYNRHMKRYLKDSGRKDVAYDFVVRRENKDLADFTWKKRFEDEQGRPISLVHGSVPVHLDKSVESKDILLDLLLEENRKLRTTMENLTGQNDTITMELKKCRTELQKFMDIKTELEASLYGKFVQLLNAKKRRIQVLEGSVQKVSSINDLGGDH